MNLSLVDDRQRSYVPIYGSMATAGKALKQILETNEISQAQLTAAMGIGRSSINRWVNESRDPAAEAVLEILAGLEKIDRAAAKEFVRLYLGEIVDEAD